MRRARARHGVNRLGGGTPRLLRALRRGRGDPVLRLSSAGRFGDDFARELMRTLPIHPYIAPEVLECLHAELLDLARHGSVEASWGRLAEREGSLEIVLPQRSSDPDRSRAVAIPG